VRKHGHQVSIPWGEDRRPHPSHRGTRHASHGRVLDHILTGSVCR
jgi:hypothetical protein